MGPQQVFRLLILPLHQLHHLAVDDRGRLRGAGQGGVSPQVLVAHRLQGHHAEIVAHAEAGDHGSGQLGGLFNIVGGAGGDGVENQILRHTAAGEGGDLVLQLLLSHQIVLVLVHLHGVSQGAGGSGHDGDLGHRGRMALKRCHQGMTDLVVGDDHLLLVGHDLVLLLVPGDHHLHALLQVRLGHHSAPVAHRPKGSLVDHIGQLRAGGAHGNPGDGPEVHVVGQLHLPAVNL